MHDTRRTTYIDNFLNTEQLLLKSGIKHIKTNLLLFCGKKKRNTTVCYYVVCRCRAMYVCIVPLHLTLMY